MLSDATPKPAPLSDSQQLTRKSDNLLTRKVWLPKVLYDALPYFYIVSGVVALFTTLYINSWFWVLPHYVLFSAGCLHLGIVVYRRRHRKRPPDA
jgi:Flp pilus assembly protein TadB